MAVKYTISYKDITNAQRRVDIDVPDYVGDPVPLRGINGGAFILNWNPDEETMSHVVISSSATIQVYQQNDAIDIFELQTAADRDIVVRYYEESVLKWQGFMVSDGIMQTFQAQPFELQLQAVDGLQLLEGINTTSPNTTATGTPNRAPINYFRDLLWNRLGNELPIRFAVDGLECVVYPDENVMAGSVQWSPRGQGFSDENGTAQNAFWTIQGQTDSFYARIYQSDGYWVVERKPSIVSGVYSAKEVTGVSITDVSMNVLKVIGKTGDYHFVNEDANLTVVKPLLKVSTLYDHTQKDNIIPNGNMDATILGTVLYWSRSADSGTLTIYSGGLNLQGGNGLRVQNNGIFGGMDIYVSPTDAAIEGMPIDAHTLFNTAEFGFTCMPIVYPVTGDGATIDWTSNPMQITIKYTLEYQGGTRDYFLNEFGYWQYEARGGDLGTVFSYQTQTEVAGDRRRNEMYFEGAPNIGDVISIGIIRNRYGSVRDYYTATCDVAEEGNLELFLNKALVQLPDSTGGWDLETKQVVMQDVTHGYIRYTITTGFGQPEVSTYKGGALQDFQRISINVDSMKLNDVARVQIQSKANEGKILLPDPGDLDNITDENVGRLFVQLHVKDGQDVVFDDVYCNVNENQDLYESVLQGTNNTAIEDRTLNISSAFSGFFNTNYMTAWTVSNTEYKFSNGIDEGSLTRLHNRDTLKMRCLPSILFSGSINVRSGGWRFGEVYEIETLNGKKFLSLGATYNTEKAEVQLRAIEAYYNNEMTIITNHYGSETEPINI